YKGDELFTTTFCSSQFGIHLFAQYSDQIDIFPLVETSDVVSTSIFSLMKHKIDSTCVIDHIQPIAGIVTIAIDRYWLVVQYIVNTQRNQFFGKMIGTVIVGTIGNDDRQSVGIVVSAHHVIGSCFGSRIRRMRIVFG